MNMEQAITLEYAIDRAKAAFAEATPNFRGVNGSIGADLSASADSVLLQRAHNVAANLGAGPGAEAQKWTHVALMIQAGVTYVFVNGVLCQKGERAPR